VNGGGRGSLLRMPVSSVPIKAILTEENASSRTSCSLGLTLSRSIGGGNMHIEDFRNNLLTGKRESEVPIGTCHAAVTCRYF